MRSPAAAFAWEFRHGHLWGLVGYVVVVGTVKLLIVGPGQPIKLDPPDGIAAAVVAPFSTVFMYLLAVFSFGLRGDLAARQSIYPARLFTLPVTTTALAGWPMLYGTAAMVGLWLVTMLLVQWPWGIGIPLLWPGLLAAVFLAWTQALMWTPYGLPGLRVIITVLWLAALDAVVIAAIHYEASDAMMVAFLAPQAPLAYLAARFAVARARRGEVPDWRDMFARLRHIARLLPRRRHPFFSPARAQLWLEWQQHGRSLPVWVAMVVPVELLVLFVPGNDTPAVIFLVLVCALLTPPFMARFAAAAISRSNPSVRDSYGVSPFLATRPLTTASLIAAKLKMMMWSTLAAWVVVLAAIAIALSMLGAWPLVIARAGEAVDAIGAGRVIVLGLLVFTGLLTATWKQLVQSLCIGLTGREWLIKGSVVLTLSFLVVIGPVIEWIRDNGDVQVALWDTWIWIPALLVAAKMSAAAWVATRLWRSRLLSDRALVTGAACWLVVVLALYGLLVWLVDTPLIPRHLLALIAILAIPLARLFAAPLALAWNRHR